MEVNVTSPEPSDSESAAEDNADREEDEMRGETRGKSREETQGEGGAQPGSSSPICKQLSPRPGTNILLSLLCCLIIHHI